MSMPEIRTEGPLGAEGKPEKANSWRDYVDALVGRLEMATPPEVLDGRMEFDLPTWLSHVRLIEGVQPVNLDIRTRKGEVRLRSDRALPDVFDEHTPFARHLEVFALTEAKIRFLQKHFPDSPALRGFDAALAVGRLRREAKFIIKNGYWSHGYHEGRRKFLAIGATALVLAACRLLPPSEAPPSTSSSTNPATAPATSTATKKNVTPTPEPTKVNFEQQGQGAYGPPLPEEAVKFTAAGGENIRSILVRSIQDGEAVLTAYEETLLVWAEKQGYSRSSVQVEFLYNGGTGDNFRWQFYLRDTTTGNVLWTADDQGAFQTYPVALSVDKIHGLYVEDKYKLREVPNTTDADVRFTKYNFVKMVAGEPVTMNDTLYYSQWFNTLTGQFEAIPGIEAPVEFRAGISESLDQVNQLHFEKLDTEMPLLVAKEQAYLDQLGITAESIAPLFIPADGRVEYNFNLHFAPYQELKMYFGHRADYNLPSFVVTSVSKVLMPSGSEDWVIGVATKREGSDKLGIFHFMIDRKAMEYWRDTLGEQNIPPENLSDDAMLAFLTSDRLQQGFRVAPFIYLRDLPPQGGFPENFPHWVDTVLVVETNLKKQNNNTQLDIVSWAVAPSSAPAMNTPEWEAAFFQVWQTNLIPIFYLSPNQR